LLKQTFNTYVVTIILLMRKLNRTVSIEFEQQIWIEKNIENFSRWVRSKINEDRKNEKDAE